MQHHVLTPNTNQFYRMFMFTQPFISFLTNSFLSLGLKLWLQLGGNQNAIANIQLCNNNEKKKQINWKRKMNDFESICALANVYVIVDIGFSILDTFLSRDVVLSQFSFIWWLNGRIKGFKIPYFVNFFVCMTGALFFGNVVSIASDFKIFAVRCGVATDYYNVSVYEWWRDYSF